MGYGHFFGVGGDGLFVGGKLGMEMVRQWLWEIMLFILIVFLQD